MSNIIKYDEKSKMDIFRLGETLAKSGYFRDASDPAKAIVKILAGTEIGFGPISSITGIHIINGKPSFSATLMASKIKGTKGCGYDVREMSDDKCTLIPIIDGKQQIPISFEIKDAKAAGLLSGPNAQTWKKYPSDMLFARCISRMARRFFPHLFSGITAYTEEEINSVSDIPNAEYDVPDVAPEPPPDSELPPDIDTVEFNKYLNDLIEKNAKLGIKADETRAKAMSQPGIDEYRKNNAIKTWNKMKAATPEMCEAAVADFKEITGKESAKGHLDLEWVIAQAKNYEKFHSKAAVLGVKADEFYDFETYIRVQMDHSTPFDRDKWKYLFQNIKAFFDLWRADMNEKCEGETDA